MAIKHAHQTTIPDDPDSDVSASEWNADHVIDDNTMVVAKVAMSATDKLIGRSTADAGVGEEIVCTAAGRALLDDTTAGDQRTTLGLGTAAVLDDAPSDGGNYGRKDGAWVATGGDPSAAWPIGSVFIAVVSTSPATLLGFGTWSAFGAGRVLVGLNAGDADFDTAEETGGAKTHTLTEAEIPAHTHVQNAHTHVQDAHTHSFLPRSATTGSVSSIVTGTLDTSSTISGANQPHIQNATAVNQNATAVNQNTGGGGAHNNVQPYIVVYMWKRTA